MLFSFFRKKTAEEEESRKIENPRSEVHSDCDKFSGFSAGPNISIENGSEIHGEQKVAQELNNPENAEGEDVTPKERSVPLDVLIRRNRNIVIDSSVLEGVSFSTFVKRNLASIQKKKCLFVANFELEAISAHCKDSLQIMFDSGILTILQYDGVTSYANFLPKISFMGQEKGQLCFLVNDQKKKRLIISAAKSAGIFVQLFSLNSEANIVQSDSRKDSIGTQRHDVARSPSSKIGNTFAIPQKDRFVIVSVPERIKIVPVRVSQAIRKGATFYDSKNNPITLNEQEIINPNAVTYSTNISGVWAKIYNPSDVNTFLEAKVTRMLSRKVQCRGLCWPTDILRDSSGNFVGFLMPLAKGEPLQLAVFKQAKLQKYFPDWNKKDLCDLAVTILRVIQYLHNMNILMGCINPAAIRVVSKDEVYFVDTDNYQVEGFPSLVYNVSFTPPELQGRKIYLCTKENENYAVAMLVFMLMMTGKTPYTVRRNQTIAQAIQERNFPFPNGSVHGSHAMPSMWRFMWSHLTPFKDVFFNTFQKGGKFEVPESRRTVGNWIGTVLRFKEELEHPVDPESLKIYPRTFKRGKNDEFYTCRYCGTAHPRFYFDNRYFDDYRICNGCIDKRSDVSFTCQSCGRTYFYTYRTALYHAMMKKKDSEWKDQKHCRDCKNKTMRCIDCGEEKPFYFLQNGRCSSCHRKAIYKNVRCKDCGREFSITNGEHDFHVQKGHSDPVRCESCRAKKKSGWF